MSGKVELQQEAVQLQTAKDAWSSGSLQVTAQELKFVGTPNVHMALGSVTGIQKAKGQPIMRLASTSGARVFKFPSVAVLDKFIADLNPLKDAAAKVAPSATNKALSTLIPKPDVQQAVFAANKDLKDMHARLVIPGHITELEFWASKQRHVRASQADVKSQPKGLSTALLALMRASPDAKTGKISIKVTADLEQQIFAEFPAVHAAYAASVPHKRPRSAFFGEFFQMLQKRIERRRKRLAGTLTANDELLTEFEEEVARHESDLQRRGRPMKKARLAAADPTVNVAADDYDDMGDGYGTRHRATAEAAYIRTEGTQAGDIARELNQHADVVLTGRAPVGSAAAGQAMARGGKQGAEAALGTYEERARSGLEDLRQPEVPQYVELSIKDPHNYFVHTAQQEDSAAEVVPLVKPDPEAPDPTGPADLPDASADPLHALRGVAHRFEAMRQAGGLEAAGGLVAWPAVAPDVAHEALGEVHVASQQDGELDEFGHRRNPTTALLPSLVHGLKQQALAINEVLRHFWHGFPINSAAKAQKMARVLKALQDLYDQTLEMQKAAQKTQEQEDRVYVSQLLRPCMQAMDAAFARHDEVAARARKP